MNRIEQVRKTVDNILLDMTDNEERRCAYIHLYGVSQACALIAQKRKINVELAVIAGMLHDISSYATMDSNDHAHKSSVMAKDILKSLDLFSENEIDLIGMTIYNHSDKSTVHNELDELLKDADVMQHILYNPLFEIKPKEQHRFNNLVSEFELNI